MANFVTRILARGLTRIGKKRCTWQRKIRQLERNQLSATKVLLVRLKFSCIPVAPTTITGYKP